MTIQRPALNVYDGKLRRIDEVEKQRKEKTNMEQKKNEKQMFLGVKSRYVMDIS